MTRRYRVRLILATHRLFKTRLREALRASEKPSEQTGAEMVAAYQQGRRGHLSPQEAS